MTFNLQRPFVCPRARPSSGLPAETALLREQQAVHWLLAAPLSQERVPAFNSSFWDSDLFEFGQNALRGDFLDM